MVEMLFNSAEYELLDFGEGQKLERFGAFIVDRPAPAAVGIRTSRSDIWSQAAARYELHGDQRGGDRGHWIPADALPERWTISFGRMRLELKPTDFGHLGVFPEQAENWEWIAEEIRSATKVGHPLKMLNLFAHTGGSTLAAAIAGAEVVHVDSSKSAVAWARRNADLSGLADARIRWIVEDAARFVRREQNRGNRYDAVILDPPSYGHGPAGETWKLDADLPALLATCAELTAGRLRFILLTCHTPAVTPARAQTLLIEALTTADPTAAKAATVVGQPLELKRPDGALLPSGVVARFPVSSDFKSQI
jgi:23S rRNA (cytosine1962-C5)-methyltransferase